MTDTYEGWSNRETWAANLWLNNDEGLYGQVSEMATESLTAGRDDEGDAGSAAHIARYHLAEQLRDMFEEWAHGEGEDEYVPSGPIYKVLTDIGSLYRVDWHEVAEGWIATAIEEAEQ